MTEDKRQLLILMPDGSRWAVPVMVIARDRAKNYADEFGGDVDRSLADDTLPLFAEDQYQITDWAANNMNWEDVKAHATRHLATTPMGHREFQEGWVNGEKQ